VSVLNNMASSGVEAAGSWWTTLTAPQATLLSGGLTFLAAVAGVLLGWWLLSGKVKDLRGAIEESDKLMKQHSASVATALGEVRSKVGALDAQFTTTLESLGQLRGAVGDIQSAASPEESAPAEASREVLRAAWERIRDHLERLAANPQIDGRTRAKYGRIDRRRYLDLVDALDWDQQLADLGDRYREAVTLWQQHRTGRRAPSSKACEQMVRLRNELVPAEPPSRGNA